jgi:pSer/pThr/pTyr-binding forkhead associated (FHA) protein
MKAILERVILQVRSGASTGRKVWLRRGQVLHVGRTQQADFVVGHDPQMSSRHFKLECGDTTCRVVDCGSRHGTFVNGQRVTEALLCPGDEISAGRTSFSVQIVGGRAVPAAEAIQSAASPQVAHWSEPASGTKTVWPPSYVEQPCYSGLTSLRGAGQPANPVAIAQRLAKAFPLFLLVDFNRLGNPLPPDLAEPDFLFDWLPPQIMAQASPVLLSAKETTQWESVMHDGWGKDGLVCLYTRQKKAELLDRLRSAARRKAADAEDAQQDAVVALAWPRIMAMLLANSPPESFDSLLSGIDAVLLEVDSAESWQVFGHDDLAQTLDRLGLVRHAGQDADPG